MRFALLEADVPSAVGTVDYTHPDVSGFDGANSGLAIVLAGGDGLDEDGHGSLSIATVVGGSTPQATMSAQAGTGRTTNLADRQQSAVPLAVHIYGNAISGADGLRASGTATRLPNGLRINWTDVDGVIAGRSYKFVVAFIFGSGFKAEGTLSSTGAVFGFDGVDAVLQQVRGIAFNTSFTDHAHAGLGGAVNRGGGIQQGSLCTAFRGGAAATSESYGYARADGYECHLTGTPPSTPHAGEVTAFNLQDVTNATLVGSPSQRHVFLHSDVRRANDFGAVLEVLDGTTGSKHFTGLGMRPGLVLGFINGVDADATVQSGAARAFCGVFVTDGVDTYCFSIAQDDGKAISGGSPTQGYSRLAHSIDVLSETGGTAFAATVTEMTDEGLRLEVTTGLAGRMFLFGFASEDQLPEPVAVPLEMPSTVVTRQEVPSPVAVPVAVPPVTLVLETIQRPDPVVMRVAVPSVAVLESIPTVSVPPVPPPLAEYYCAALRDLLPRGLAWTRDPESVLGRLLCALAEELARVEFRGLDLTREADVRRSVELLDAWEEWLRTAETCPEDTTPTSEQRRFACLVRLIEPGGQNAYHYSQVAQRLGYDVDVEDLEELREFRAGISVAGDSLSNGEWRFVVVVHAPVQTPIFARAGVSSAGDPIATGGNDRLACELDRIRPAHVLFLYSFDKPYSGFAPWNIVAPSPVAVPLVLPIPSRSSP